MNVCRLGDNLSNILSKHQTIYTYIHIICTSAGKARQPETFVARPSLIELIKSRTRTYNQSYFKVLSLFQLKFNIIRTKHDYIYYSESGR